MRKFSALTKWTPKTVVSIVVLTTLSACAVTPTPLTQTDVQSAAADRKARYVPKDQVPVTGAIGLHEAMARALKYNLDRKIEIAKLQMRSSQLDISKMEMLPQFVASSEFSKRDNDPGSYSVNLGTGSQSTTASRSVDRESQSSDSRALSDDGQSDPLVNLKYQRDMLRLIVEIKGLRRDLDVAKRQLAALINVPPTQTIRVRTNDYATPLSLKMAASQLVDLALLNRPELREISYEMRNLELDKKSAALGILPSISPFVTASASTNDLLVNRDWMNAGVRVSWDLLGVATQGSQTKLYKNSQALLDARSLALTQAIATQVHVAHARFGLLKDEVKAARDYRNVSRKIAKTINDQAETGSAGNQDSVYEEMNAILAEMRYDTKFAELQNTYANLFSSIGLNMYPIADVENIDLVQLKDQIHATWQAMGEGIH
jgi:outer membrane protein TolC